MTREALVIHLLLALQEYEFLKDMVLFSFLVRKISSTSSPFSVKLWPEVTYGH